MIADGLRVRPWAIVVDSVAAMTPLQALEGKVDEAGRIGLVAQLMSTFLQYITKFLQDTNVALIFTNQMRKVISTTPGRNYGPTEESTGGVAMKYYSSVRLKLDKGSVEKVQQLSRITGKVEKEPVHVTSWVSVIKNKIDKPFRVAPVYIKFGVGFDNIRSIIELATNINLIKRSGAFFTFNQGNEQLIKAQGKQALWDTLNDNPKLFKALQDSLVLTVDEKIKEQYKEDQGEDDVTDVDALLNSTAEAYVEKANKKKEAKESEGGQEQQ